MIFYTILEIIDAVEHIDSLGSTTENLCLTITHIAGIIKVCQHLFMSQKYHPFILKGNRREYLQIINLTVHKNAFYDIIDMIRSMMDEYIVSDEQVCGPVIIIGSVNFTPLFYRNEH